MRAPTLFTLAVLAILAGPATAAVPPPELAVQVGRSFAVDSPEKDVFDQGGFTGALSIQWPWEDRFRFGVNLFATDLGFSNPTGLMETGHLAAMGGSWRADALGPTVAHLGRTYASATYGYYRLGADRQGAQLGARSAVGGSLAVGIEHALSRRTSLGLAASGTLLTQDLTRRFLGVNAELRWRP